MSSKSEASQSAQPPTRLHPLLAREPLHPTSDPHPNPSLSPSTCVFSEQEKAFFKRSEALQQTSSLNRNKEAPLLVSPDGPASPAMIAQPRAPHPSRSGDVPSTSSFKYDNIPPYRATTSSNRDDSAREANRNSNQFGVLVPGWGDGVEASRDGPSDNGGASMQFVPVITKGTGAPGRGPTKRKKP
ncbi:hypothetical protein FRB90_003009 [Tulasnella sp. 427]|nr:hypothetical protein FRB90_003009 [Tulasnella sp. 427]